jgi:hypothetical protein
MQRQYLEYSIAYTDANESTGYGNSTHLGMPPVLAFPTASITAILEVSFGNNDLGLI